MTELRPLPGLVSGVNDMNLIESARHVRADFDVRGLLAMLRRQFRLILSTIVIIVGLAAIALFSITPVYQASTLVLVDPSRKNLLDPGSQIASTATDSARVDSEVEILRSDAVLMSVIQPMDLLADPEFGVKLRLLDKIQAFLGMKDATLPSGEMALADVLQRLRQNVSVQRRGLTYLIAVQVNSRDSAKAATLANALADAYISSQVDAKIKNILVSKETIQNQIDQSQAAVIAAETGFANFVTENLDRIIAATGRTDLAQIRERLDALIASKGATGNRAANLRKSLAENDWTALTESLQSDAATELNRQRQSLLKSLAQADASSADAINLRAELAKVENSLDKETRTKLVELDRLISTDDQQLTETRRELSAAVLSSNLPPDILAQMLGLQEKSSNATDKYQALLRRAQDLETESELQVADSRIVSPALAPTKPAFPRVSLILSVVGVVALGLGVGLAFMFENYVGGFTSEEQLEWLAKLPISAVLPRQRATMGSFSVSDSLVDAPLSRFAESVRRLRASIDRVVRRSDFSAAGKSKPRSPIVMVSSALPSEGKTTVALSLARTYAGAGSSVLVIDCDLRKPSVHRHFGVETVTGLADSLAVEASANLDLSKILFRDPKTSLTAILGARRADLPTDQLVTKSSFAKLLSVATNRFDVVILDSPPIEPVVDGLYLAQYAQVIVFVVQWAKTPQGTALNALNALRAAKDPACEVAVVLNQQEGRSISYKSAYSSYYSE